MSKYRANVLFEGLAMVFLTIYIFYALTNLFFVPNYTSDVSKTSTFSGVHLRRQTVRVRPEALNFIAVSDKSIAVDDQFDVIKSIPVIFLFIFSGFGFLKIKSKLISPQTIIYNITEYPYLSFCKLRI